MPAGALAPLVLALALGTTGCTVRTTVVGEGPASEPVVLVVSETWIQNTGDGDAVQARLAALRDSITALRAETGTGWIGRQDEVTGYLAELTGGSRIGSPTDFMDDYGTELFGLDSTGLRLGQPDSVSVPGVTSWRAAQVVGGVPVLDGYLVLTSRLGELGTDDDRVTGVWGRVFPGLSVATEPSIGARRAARIAERASRGTLQKPPELVVMPIRAGRLAWAVTVAATSDGSTPLAGGVYYVDAVTGDLLGIRAGSADGRLPLPVFGDPASYGGAGLPGRRALRTLRALDPDPNSVEVTGENPIGGTLTGYGVRTDAGVTLVDTTTPTWDQATRRGGLFTYDATGLRSSSQLPGKLVTSPDTTIRDDEAMAAQALSREVYDYYLGLGRQSWDNRGGSLVSSVNYGPSDYCNSFFTVATTPPQMVYGNPCTTEAGQVEVTEVEIDTAAHEITHGVTDTSAGLTYSGQSGALNESFSDYLGNVIGNKVNGTDSAAVFENGCTGYTEETLFCRRNPDGSLSLRYMLNGNDFDDYLRVLDAGYRLYQLGLADQDSGGVHSNSAIWNNALWSIRVQLARIDNQPGNDSPLAQAFDRVVYAALTTRLVPTSGFLDARAAIEQVIIDSQLDPVVLRVSREVFDANKICAGCPTIGPLGGDTVTASPQTQLHPTVSRDQVAWLDLSAGGDFSGYSASVRVGGGAPTLGATSDAVQVAFAGDALLTFSTRGEVNRYVPGAAAQRLAQVQFLPTFAAGLAGSDAGGAWVTGAATVSFVDPTGQVTSAPLPDLSGDSVVGLGTGGGTVALGTDAGRVFNWRPGGQVTSVGSLPGAVISVATYGGNILAIDDGGKAVLFASDGQRLDVSSEAAPFGATMSEQYAVWPQVKGQLEAGVTGGASRYPETDLYLLSLSNGKIYDLIPHQGQQGFPSISGLRLAWQDAAFGGDDILTAELPAGL